MSDISQQITELLSDPNAMDQIRSLSGLFGQSAQSGSPPAPSVPPPTEPQRSQGADMLPALMKFMPLINSLKEDDDAIRLLYAVKPFLSEARQEKLDQAIRIIRIIRIVPLLKDNGILNLF